MARRLHPNGPISVQILYSLEITGEDYVTQKAWLKASPPCCPLHPKGGCGFARHGTYERHSPPGSLIPRWYCPRGHRTFSLLPNHLCSHLPGTLAEVEALVLETEQACSREAMCSTWRTDIELPGALRWIRRRIHAIHTVLLILKGLLPEYFADCGATLQSMMHRLDGVGDESVPVLARLRLMTIDYLQHLPTPFGFNHWHHRHNGTKRVFQQSMGPDPPDIPP